MRMVCIVLGLLCISLSVHTNEQTVSDLKSENKLFIITLDGLRWQEVFGGADSAILANPAYTANVSLTKKFFWGSSAEERRQKLLPFFWNTLVKQGELYGNRRYGNKMNVANPYALSYPGYNELLTGQADPTIFGNGKAMNKNLSVLEYLNATVAYRGKVAAFSSWDAFPFILNREKSKVYINSGFEPVQDHALSAAEVLVNNIQHSITDKKTTRYDELTFITCKEYIKKKKPSVVLLSFGGTDEAAHDKQYDRYLQQANNADRMIGELWHYLQALPEYAGKTTFVITTDHGRGAAAHTWHTHGVLVGGSSQTWMAITGNGVGTKGEIKTTSQHYLKDIKNMALKTLAY